LPAASSKLRTTAHPAVAAAPVVAAVAVAEFSGWAVAVVADGLTAAFPPARLHHCSAAGDIQAEYIPCSDARAFSVQPRCGCPACAGRELLRCAAALPPGRQTSIPPAPCSVPRPLPRHALRLQGGWKP